MKAALVVFDDMTMLDFIGFYDAVTRLPRMGFMPDFTWNVCALTAQVSSRGQVLHGAQCAPCKT